MKEAPREVYGELVCGHRLLLCDPDMDVAGSEWCSKCEMWLSFVAFSEDGGSR